MWTPMKPDLRSRLFHAWFLMTRPMTLGVRALAFDADRRVLLVKHTYVAGWHLPGGGWKAARPRWRRWKRNCARKPMS
jgi:hypothetical protein